MNIDSIIKDFNLSKEKREEIKNLPFNTQSKDCRLKDKTGLKNGHLTFLGLGEKKNGRNYWWVICDCPEHNIFQIRGDAKTQSCGCITKQRMSLLGQQHRKDLTNQKFNKLTVLYMLPNRKDGNIVWHCKCDCGNELDIISQSLINGNTKSCGCLKKEKAFFTQYKSNLIGQKFGYLTVLEETKERQYEKVVWKCQCECGNIIYLNTSRLKSGNDISCGCKKQSLGALNIKKILDNNNILYIKEYTNIFLNKMRFDFAIVNSNSNIIRLIEYDGEQHFRITGGWNNEKTFKERKKRDQLKNQWAKENNIPLVRIPYWERDNITLDMLLGDKYLVS